MTLTEFLLVRIAEDEAAAKGVRTGLWDEIGFHDLAADDVPHVVNWSPARVLAECEAKRRLMDLGFQHAATVDGEWGCCHDAETIRAGYIKAAGDWEEDEPLPERCDAMDHALPHLKALAMPYADHPDYRDEWRP